MVQSMAGDAPLIRLNNGIEVTGETKCYFDPRRIKADAINCISHAHSDHLPKSFESNKAIASSVTLRCASERVKRIIEPDQSDRVEMHDAGHIIGSQMFLLKDSQKVLYTGDLCPQDRMGMLGARPVKTDTLLIEATYGRPRYVFPHRDEIAKVMRDWVEDNLAQGHPVALMTYALGKSQVLARYFSDLEPYLHGSVWNNTKIVEECCGDPYSCRCYDAEKMDGPFLMICPMERRASDFRSYWHKRGVRFAVVTGWVMDGWWKRSYGVDEGFPLSDHADFLELIEFVRGCSPSRVYTTHGFSEELAVSIQDKLGIEAIPLKRKQRSLVDF